jgi:hypothetical protein
MLKKACRHNHDKEMVITGDLIDPLVVSVCAAMQLRE